MNSPHFFLFELYEGMPEKIRIGRNEYSTLKLCYALEELTGQKIISRTHKKILKKWVNTAIEFSVIQAEKPGEPLRVISRGGELIELWHTV